MKLELGLVAEGFEGLGPHAVDKGSGRSIPEALERGDAGRGEPVHGGPPQPGHENEMVVGLQPPMARTPPQCRSSSFRTAMEVGGKLSIAVRNRPRRRR